MAQISVIQFFNMGNTSPKILVYLIKFLQGYLLLEKYYTLSADYFQFF